MSHDPFEGLQIAPLTGLFNMGQRFGRSLRQNGIEFPVRSMPHGQKI
jgi:hypothetical protein